VSAFLAKCNHNGIGAPYLVIQRPALIGIANRCHLFTCANVVCGSNATHPNIVLYMGVAVSEGGVMLVSEFVRRGDLEHRLHSADDIPLLTRLFMARDTAHGMAWYARC
jgi:hypothetical protein